MRGKNTRQILAWKSALERPCLYPQNEFTRNDTGWQNKIFFFFWKFGGTGGENLMKTSIHPAALQLWASHRHPTDQSPRLPAGLLRLWSMPSWPLGTHSASTNSTQVDADKETQNWIHTTDLACFPRALFMPSGFNQGWITPSSFN